MNLNYVALVLAAVSVGLIFLLSNNLIKLAFIVFGKFLSIPGLPIDPSSVLSIFWLPVLIRENRKILFQTGLSISILVLAIGQAASILWSFDKLEGLREVSYTLAVLTMFLVFCRPGTLEFAKRIFVAIAPVLIICVFSIAAFRLSPDLERAYLHTSVAQLFIGPEAPQLFTGRPNNVLLDERAAGLFFVNSNRASMVLGVHSMLFFALSYQASRPYLWRLVAGILLFGVFLTGSKTGLILGMLLTIICSVILARKGPRAVLTAFGLLLTCTAYISLKASGTRDIDAAAYADSWSDRLPMWRAAASFLTESPLTGLGFGGWKIEWGKVFWLYGKPASFPPHNTLIANYSDSGIIAAIATIAIGALGVYHLLHTLRMPTANQRARKNRATNAWCSAVLIWAFVHSLGDNTSFYGVGMTMAAYGCAMALLRGVKEGEPRVGARSSEEHYAVS